MGNIFSDQGNKRVHHLESYYISCKYLPISGTWRAVPFPFQLTTIASLPAAWISLSLQTSVMAPSLSPPSFFLTDLKMRRAAMWVQRELFRMWLHLYFSICVSTVEPEHTYYKTLDTWTMQLSRKKKGSKQTLLNTWELCSNGFLFFNVRVWVYVRVCFNEVLFMYLSLTDDKSAQMLWVLQKTYRFYKKNEESSKILIIIENR